MRRSISRVSTAITPGGSRSGGGEGNRDSDGWYYLAVGNTLRHGDTRAPINVYRWDPDKKAFVFHHGAPVKFGGNDPKDPLTGLPLPAQLSIEKLVSWELDGEVYVAAAVSRVARQLAVLKEDPAASCQDWPAFQTCVANISLECGSVPGPVVRYSDWLSRSLAHNISNCTALDSAQVCAAE
eukprot:14754_1